jgi:hypothetical protein
MNHVRPALLVLAAVITVGCSERTEQQSTADRIPQAEVAVTVNGKPISMAVFRLHALNALNKDEGSLTEEERRAVVEDLVDFTLLTQAAEKAGLLDGWHLRRMNPGAPRSMCRRSRPVTPQR